MVRYRRKCLPVRLVEVPLAAAMRRVECRCDWRVRKRHFERECKTERARKRVCEVRVEWVSDIYVLSESSLNNKATTSTRDRSDGDGRNARVNFLFYKSTYPPDKQ